MIEELNIEQRLLLKGGRMMAAEEIKVYSTPT
jgi:hypothetical protein